MKLLLAISALMLIGCGNARTPGDAIDDAIKHYRAQLEALVGQTRSQIVLELGVPKSSVLDSDTLHEVLNYELTDADAQLILNARAELENFMLQRRIK